ncbi:MAG: PqqD family protein [Deltaproteobacteria bacterium]|nr:PqqD family protein [Deltaproteobacteria bacterium]
MTIVSRVVLCTLLDGIYYSMDRVGGLIWEMLAGAHSPEEVTTAILARYDVSSEQVQADVERLAAELLQENLLLATNDGVEPQTLAEPDNHQKLPYEMPVLNIYRDMGDLLALDPPTPGLQDIAWKDPDDESSH